MSKNPPEPGKPRKSRSVPSVDDPTAAFPIGVLAGLIEDGSEEGRTPGGAAERSGVAATAARTPPPPSTTGLQLRLLGLSLLVGMGAATVVALMFGAAMFVVGR